MIDVVIADSGPTPAVNIDPNQLEMALLNLAINARDAMPLGGILLRGRDPKLPILLATGYAELQSELPIELPRIAKPYTQEQLSFEIARLLPDGTT
jgi:hypothetical protein